MTDSIFTNQLGLQHIFSRIDDVIKHVQIPRINNFAFIFPCIKDYIAVPRFIMHSH